MNARCIAIGLGLLFANSSQGQRIGTEAWWAATNADGVQQVHVRCGTDFLDPKEIVVRQNIAVEVTVRATDNLRDHVFRIPQLRSLPALPINASANALRFVPAEKGSFPMLCAPNGGQDSASAAARKRGVFNVVP
jgi:heme/copper-type cytochrome/quinol oxidase subunit 2